MLELRDHALADVLGLLLILGLVLGHGVQDGYPSPLGTLSERYEQPR